MTNYEFHDRVAARLLDEICTGGRRLREADVRVIERLLAAGGVFV